MGDLRFDRPYLSVRDARDRHSALRSLDDEEVVQALAAASRFHDALLSNVLATEAMNRIRHLRGALANLSEGVLAMGPRGEVHWMNPAAEELLGLRRQDVACARFDEIIEHLDEHRHPVPLERSPVMRAALDGLHTTGDGEHFSVRGGREVWVAYMCAPFLSELGEPVGAVLAFHDCSGRKSAELEARRNHEIYRSIFVNSADAMVSFSREGQLIDANAAAVELTMRSVEGSRGKSFGEFVHADDFPAILAMFEGVLRGERREARMRILHQDGRPILMDVLGIPAMVDGEVVGLHGIMRPIEDARGS